MSPALCDYKLIFTSLCRDSSSGMVLLRFPNKHKKSWSQASLRPRGIPTAHGYNAPCFESVVHYFMGSVLMRWDNEDRRDRLSIALAEYSVFPEPGVRRVRATIPAGQSQCSGRREPVSFPLLLCITTGCAEHGGQGCCAWPPCRLSAFSHEFASHALTNI